jgi:hypothetical protein
MYAVNLADPMSASFRKVREPADSSASVSAVHTDPTAALRWLPLRLGITFFDSTQSEEKRENIYLFIFKAREVLNERLFPTLLLEKLRKVREI